MEAGYGSAAHAAEHLRRLLQKALEQAFPGCETEKVPVGTSQTGGQWFFSSGLVFSCAAVKKISPAEAADRLSAFLPARDAVFDRIEKSGGYLNFAPSAQWYAACAAFLLRNASFSAWRITEEDFGFFAGASPAVKEVQKAFVRLCSVLRGCRAEGLLELSCPPEALSLLKSPQETALLFSLARLPDDTGSSLLPSLLEVSRAFHRFYDSLRVWSPDPHLTAARVSLCLACGGRMQKSLQQLGLLCVGTKQHFTVSAQKTKYF